MEGAEGTGPAWMGLWLIHWRAQGAHNGGGLTAAHLRARRALVAE